MAVYIEVKVGKTILENRAFEVVPRQGELIRNTSGNYFRVTRVVHRHVEGGPTQVGIVVEAVD